MSKSVVFPQPGAGKKHQCVPNNGAVSVGETDGAGVRTGVKQELQEVELVPGRHLEEEGVEGGVGGRHLSPPGDGRTSGRSEGRAVTTENVINVTPGEATPGQLAVALSATEMVALPTHVPPREDSGSEAGLLQGVQAGGCRGPVQVTGGQREVRTVEVGEGRETAGLS